MTVWDRENEPAARLGDRRDFDEWASEVKDAINSRIPIFDGLGFEDLPPEPDDRVDVWLDHAAQAAAGFIVVCVVVLGVVAVVRWRS